MQKKLTFTRLVVLMAGLWFALPLPVAAATATVKPATTAETGSVPDSKQLEKELQQLNWKQFRSVIESVPELKSSVEGYGPVGWDIVKANYTTYKWRKLIDKLDPGEKQRLSKLIQTAKVSN